MGEVVALCFEAVVPEDETPLHGWEIISVNKWNVEQRRILLLTSRGFYRVKFDFETNQVIHFKRTDLLDLAIIQKGLLGVSGPAKELFAIRTHCRSSEGVESFQTFFVPLAAGKTASEQEAEMVGVVNAFAKARRELNEVGFCISDYNIARPRPLGPLSSLSRNMFSL